MTGSLFQPAAVAMAVAAAVVLTACADRTKPDEEEMAKNTIVCQLGSERVVIRFDAGEARLLVAGADRITLYQIPSGTNIRYSNGMMELRGKGMALELVRYGAATELTGCQPYAVPK